MGGRNAMPMWRFSTQSSGFPFFLFLFFSLLLPAFGSDTLSEAWLYRRDLVLDEGWRLLTAHWVHMGWPHTLLNLAGLALVWLLVGRELGWFGWLGMVVGSAFGISLMLWGFNPRLDWYMGFSGVIHALIFVGGLLAWQRGEKDSVLLLSLLIAKLAFEQLKGATPGSEMLVGGPVVVDSHLYGAVCGVIGFVLLRCVAVRKTKHEG